jgi:hypothetical protein
MPNLPLYELPFPRDPVIEAYKRDVDVTLLIENLKLTPEQRIVNLQALVRFQEDLRTALLAAKRRS